MDRAAGVWTVRGVGLEFRKMAKAAAAETGKTLGKWMELSIALGAGIQENHEPEKKSPEAVQDWSMNPVAVEAGHVPFDPAPQAAEEVPPIRAHGRKPRVVCQHGMEKGYNCWQCGGLAVVK